jgi:hypothetical protein
MLMAILVACPTQFYTIHPEWALANDPLTPGPHRR